MRSILAAAGAGGPGCPPRSRALDLPEGCGRVRCSSCRQSAGRTCRNSSCLGLWRAPGDAYPWSIRRPFLDDANGLHHGRERARRGRTRQGAGPAGQAARRLPMQSICISAEPVAGRPQICIAGADRTDENPDTARPLDVPTRERPAANCSGIRLFFGCSSVGAVADHRPASVAGSVVTRHPAGGSTRRRSMVSMSGGPFRADHTVGAHLQRATRHPT